MMLNKLPGYVSRQQLWLHIGIGSCHIQLVHFQAAQFKLEAFRQAGIASPYWLGRCAPRRQGEYFFGRLAAALALMETKSKDINVGTGSMREPLFPFGIKGSITHTCDFAAAAVLPRSVHGLGIDIEAALDPEAISSVEKLVLSSAEQAFLVRETALPYSVLLALAFSAKETFYKATAPSVGRFFDFAALHLQSIDWNACCINFVVTELLSQDWYQGCEVKVNFLIFPNHHVLTAWAW